MTDKILVFVSIYFPLLLVPLFISSIDFITVLRSKVRKTPHIDNNNGTYAFFNILIPIFGDIKYLKNVEFLRPYGNRVILCTTSDETPEFYAALKQVVKQNNFRVFMSRSHSTSKKSRPNPWRLFSRTLEGEVGKPRKSNAIRDEIIRDSFSVVRAKYCIFLDGDTVANEPFSKLISHFIKMNYDVASVRVLVAHPRTLAERLQAIEYELSMDARKIYPWLTSGACMVTKTDVIREIMTHHSLFFSGGDIEIGKLAKLLRYKVGYIPFALYTDAPETFRAWFKQRMAWCGGGFRHAIINAHRYSWRHPIFYLYTTVVVYGMTPLRWYEAFKHPLIVPLVIVLYWLLLFLTQWRNRSMLFFIFPFYALVQIMFIVPLGIYTYFKMAYHGHNIGHIKLRFKDRPARRDTAPGFMYTNEIL